MLRHMFQNRFVQIAALAAVISIASGLYYFKGKWLYKPRPIGDIAVVQRWAARIPRHV